MPLPFLSRRPAAIAALLVCFTLPVRVAAEPETPAPPGVSGPVATEPPALTPPPAPPDASGPPGATEPAAPPPPPTGVPDAAAATDAAPGASAAEPAPVTPEPAAVSPADAATAAPKPKVLLLPVEFTVFQLSAAGPEAMPDWTAAARKNLNEALEVALEGRTGMEIIPLPTLTEAERKILDAHVGVARLIVREGSTMGGKIWATRRAEFDRQLGPGLAWLRERSGADFAVLVAGSQYEQSGGLVFAQVLAAAAGVIVSPGGGTNISTALLDLGTGEVKWFNSTFGVEVMGIGSIDFRKVESSATVLRNLMAPYPRIPALEVKP